MRPKLKRVPQRDRQRIKRLVDDFSRKEVAKRMRMPYDSLSRKLRGEMPLTRKEATKIMSIIGGDVKK